MAFPDKSVDDKMAQIRKWSNRQDVYLRELALGVLH